MIAALAAVAAALAVALVIAVVMHLRARSSTAERLGRIAHRFESDPERNGNIELVDRSLEDWIGYLETVATTAAMTTNLADRDRARWQLALNELAVGVVLVDEDGTVCASNALADEMMTARHAMALVGAAVAQLLEFARAGHSRTRTVKLTGPPPRVIEVSAHPVSGDQHALGAVAVIVDRTEGARIDDVRRDFVANLSHELRTPVGAIALLAETLDEEDEPDVRSRLVVRIGTEADRVSDIIEDLLELSRVEMEGSMRSEAVPIVPLLTEVVHQYSEHARKHSVELVWPLTDSGVVLHADRSQLVRAVGNLVDNAIKYSDPGSRVRLSVGSSGEGYEPPRPDWFARDGVRDDSASFGEEVGAAISIGEDTGLDGDEWVDVVVADEGIGIPADATDRVFERFYRVDKARARATGGTGLGLSIVRHVVENHGGSVMLQSSEGLGTTFTLRFPVPADDASDASDASEPDADEPVVDAAQSSGWALDIALPDNLAAPDDLPLADDLASPDSRLPQQQPQQEPR